jgi:hypothetical protein
MDKIGLRSILSGRFTEGIDFTSGFFSSTRHSLTGDVISEKGRGIKGWFIRAASFAKASAARCAGAPEIQSLKSIS